MRINIGGGARRDRTDDLYNAIVALSQLSYGPASCRSIHYIDCAAIKLCGSSKRGVISGRAILDPIKCLINTL